MDIQTLKAFVAISQSGSFSRAAGTLHLTQPAISKRLHALEKEVGARLMDRSGRQLHLTEAGRALLPQARKILDEVDNAGRLIQNLQEKVAGPLRFGTSHHIGLHHLPELLRDFTGRHPEVALDIHFQESELAYQAVLDRTVEFAFVTLAELNSPGIEEWPLWQDPLAFVVARDHPLASRPVVTLEDLTRVRAVLPQENSHTCQLIRNRFDQARLPLATTLPVNYLETIKMMVSVGLGWSALPEAMLDEQLHALPLRGTRVRRELGVITRRGRTLSNAARAFLDLAR